MKIYALLVVMFFSTCSTDMFAAEGEIDTSEINTLTIDATLSCLEWEAVGICVWMTCVLVVCEFDTTLKVKNYAPDLLVQVYNNNLKEPWTESQEIIELLNLDHDSDFVRSILDAGASIADNDAEDLDINVAGGTNARASAKHSSNLSFYMVDAFGSPGILGFGTMASSSFGNVCAANATPYFLHYNSNLDAIAWRWNFPELFYPMSWAVGFDTLGGLANNWGPIYPRMGFSVAIDPLKSAVNKAFRAAHFITGNSSARIVNELSHASSDGYWPYGPLDQDDPNTGKWQQLYPEEDSTCQSFPYSATGNHESRRSDNASYVWNFWKAYKCCSKNGTTLVFHTG